MVSSLQSSGAEIVVVVMTMIDENLGSWVRNIIIAGRGEVRSSRASPINSLPGDRG